MSSSVAGAILYWNVLESIQIKNISHRAQHIQGQTDNIYSKHCFHKNNKYFSIKLVQCHIFKPASSHICINFKNCTMTFSFYYIKTGLL